MVGFERLVSLKIYYSFREKYDSICFGNKWKQVFSAPMIFQNFQNNYIKLKTATIMPNIVFCYNCQKTQNENIKNKIKLIPNGP